MYLLKNLIKKIVPNIVFSAYHIFSSYLAAFIYGFPSRKLINIGITGTKGKTSTANITWSVLTAGGYKTGLIGTANFKIGEIERPNSMHMTMPGPWVIQKLFKEMVDNGCTHLVMEVSSEGLKQYRHKGIDFKYAVFTNLSPEHLPSHGNSFEKYKEAKAELFKTLKKIPGSVSIINSDSEFGKYYSQFSASKIISYGINSGEIRASKITDNNGKISFLINNENYNINLLGQFNIYNTLPAIIIGREFGIPYDKICSGLESIVVIPGRMQKIDEGQNFTVIIDYAHEELSINTLLDSARQMTKGKIIVLIGAEGGGRDKRKREHLGKVSGIKADYVLVTNTDPYDGDPEEIIQEVSQFSESVGKVRNETLFCIEDRREAIKKGYMLAKEGDIVLITGKGAEMTMVMKDGHVPWDERKIVRDLLIEHLKKS